MDKKRTIPLIPEDHGTHLPGRRAFLKVMAASAALASAACKGPPLEQIVPYVNMPELLTPGQPTFYATAFMRRGRAHGVLVESNMGRPTKVEGNPHHPASLGATDVFAQASVLQLWDPDRSQTVFEGESLSTWEAFQHVLAQERAGWERNGGEGLRILTGSVTSPTLIAQLSALLRRYPKAAWHVYEPLHDDRAILASRQAFGKIVEPLYRFDRAQVVVSFDADVFGDWPGSIPYARAFMRNRTARQAAFSSRVYAIETTPTLTGAVGDERLALPPADIERLVWRVAAALGVPGMGPASAEIEKWAQVLARQLDTHRGRSLIVAGGTLSPETRTLVHLLNARLGNVGNTVSYIDAVDSPAEPHVESISALVRDIHDAKVRSLILLDTNPVYSAPADLAFGKALSRVPFSVHLGLYRDETGRAATWHLPQTHCYEHWSDGRAFDGTASIVQPIIAPLYQGRSLHEVVELLAGQSRSGYSLVRGYWQDRQGKLGNANFEQFWQTALRTGVAERSFSPLRVRVPAMPPLPVLVDGTTLQAVLVADASVGDGAFANNGWLQELPRPFTKLTWDNAALIGSATAKALKVETGDVVRLRAPGQPQLQIEAPVWVLPGQADLVVTLPAGYGRRAAGSVGDGVGFDAYMLLTTAAANQTFSLLIEKTGRRHEFATTQGHATMEGRDIVRWATLAAYRQNPRFATDVERERTPEVSLYPEWTYDRYKWGMAIDLNACIGCNACTIACQAENNIPVVGKDEVMRGREMHWIRVDRYYIESSGKQRTVFQPVPCMHCEKAPCEEVCPVGATVHDSEGLNVQVYNRCVGTRFCSNNCPYKVRRFNFLQFSNQKVESLKAAQNPEVTVRMRGVMEKCTYCLQRITRARLEAEKLRRPLRDGEVVTACQAVCPTEAIVFGDLNDPDSRVNHAKASPLNYSLLADLNTRPRTTYAARIFNPDRELE
ncbi:quinol:cytochrome c oxidoreductase iron-sulfur protein precursor [Paucimonas lemoignei]|uniref:Quinol:cytochrome c oxidoreductase iron-sulfur protein n=1 Tax=Paucimonas lemoignei TaxID=29443 RepID=A0A4R3I1F5_PAULE|nr:4Fe-4S dicluster domain-containing protein [Paucimonas lemoignei]TCS39362.1 quinol:cytochrome c oxidoreductase iron-sulfur protein precursor [Paucimonas lemoignei]